MFRVNRVVDARGRMMIEDPPIAKLLFQSTSAAWVWLLVRVYLGWAWLDAGWHKVQDAAWITNGEAILGFWKRAVAVPAPPARPLITYDWYRQFIQFLIDSDSHVWFGKAIAVGEVLVGLGLIVGALVGIAAFFGALMNASFLLAGTVSTNPVLLILGVLLMLAWKNAGYIGIDRWLLPALGTPWSQPRLTTEGAPAPAS